MSEAKQAVHPSQAHWPTEHAEVVKYAARALGGIWPAELESGRMFYMGERVTREEFLAAAKATEAA